MLESDLSHFRREPAGTAPHVGRVLGLAADRWDTDKTLQVAKRERVAFVPDYAHAPACPRIRETSASAFLMPLRICAAGVRLGFRATSWPVTGLRRRADTILPRSLTRTLGPPASW